MRTALCLPLSSVPPRLSGPSLPSPPSMLKSFEAHMWADSAHFSSRHDSFYVSQVLNRHRIEAYRVIMNPNTLERQARPGHPVTCQYCRVLYLSTQSLCASVCPREGSLGYAHQLTRPSTLSSVFLEGQCHGRWHKQHKRAKAQCTERDLCFSVMFWITAQLKSQRILPANKCWKC